MNLKTGWEGPITGIKVPEGVDFKVIRFELSVQAGAKPLLFLLYVFDRDGELYFSCPHYMVESLCYIGFESLHSSGAFRNEEDYDHCLNATTAFLTLFRDGQHLRKRNYKSKCLSAGLSHREFLTGTFAIDGAEANTVADKILMVAKSPYLEASDAGSKIDVETIMSALYRLPRKNTCNKSDAKAFFDGLRRQVLRPGAKGWFGRSALQPVLKKHCLRG